MPAGIDVHHHFIPPQFIELWNKGSGKAHGLSLPPWTLDDTLKLVEQAGLSAAILSLAHPVHPYVENLDEVAPICRGINRYIAQHRDAHPDKLGFFATLPSLVQTDACIQEICYSADELHADGFIIFCSYAGLYLGHEKFREVWAELNKRKAIVLVHPSFGGIAPIEVPRQLPSPIIDWTHETTRTAIHLITENNLRDFPDCSIILSHAGGTLPFVARRAARLCTQLGIWGRTVEEFIDEAQRFYVDSAFSGYMPQLKLLRDFFGPRHLLFGSDYPFEEDNMIFAQAKAISNVFGDDISQVEVTLFHSFRNNE